MKEISLLWTKSESAYTELAEDTLHNLDMNEIVLSVTNNKKEQDIIKNILTCLPQKKETVSYRIEIFDELMKNRKLCHTLSEIILDIENLKEYGISGHNYGEGSVIWDFITRLRELELYVSCIEKLLCCLTENNVYSSGFITLKEYVQTVYDNGNFKQLQNDIKMLSDDISKVKGLKLGVNLDFNLNPTDVVLLDITEDSYSYKEDSSILHSFLHMMSDGFSNTVLHNSKLDFDPLKNNLTRRIESILKDVVKDLKCTLNKYVDINGYAVINLMPELIFYLRFAEKIRSLKEHDFIFVKPELSDDNTTLLTGFYNFKLATKSDCTSIIGNNLEFTNESRRYILTGPNRGGKTILTQGLGLCVLLAQNGLYVPATSVKFTLVDNIYTHFPVDENVTVEYGRLGDEAKRIHDIFERATSSSLILLNESFSTTSYSESIYIARDIVKAVDFIDASMIYNTHMHELANLAEEDNTAISLVMEIDQGNRTYHVKKAPPAGFSHANDIAIKFGISYNQMIALKK